MQPVFQMTNKDRSFDGLSQRFRKNIYDSPKGQLRLALCWRELLEQLPGLKGEAPLHIWDAGGGLGQMSLRLAELGHQLLYSDLSGEMADGFTLELASHSAAERVTVLQQSIQDVAAQQAMAGRFDVIVCHAVLEWVEDGPALLAALKRCLKPGGVLSLMFYNLNALVLSNIGKGNLYKLRDEAFAGHPGSFTPPSPRRPHEVIDQLQQLGLEVQAKRGIRLVYDLMPRPIRDARSYDDVEAIEWQYGAQEPFWALGRYVHVLCKNTLHKTSSD
jgi:S-adenosylmethionine-dependent methyltransferase